jgi:hypothetical protein
MATLINGDGNQAVYAAQDADLLSGAITNNKTVILDVGEKFRAEVLSSSIIEVHDGVILTKEGRRIQLDQNAVDLFEFPAGAQGVVSWYYIGYKLEIDEDSHQICSTFVQKMDSEGDTIPEGSFRDGDQEVYISIYHVQQDTLGVLTPTLVLTENMTMIDVLNNLIGSASDLPDPTKTITKNIDQINNDLYDTESWVPVLYYRNGTTPLSYTRTNAKAIKIGHLVFLTARLEVTSVGNGSGLLVRDFSGALPYTPNSSAIGNIEFQGKMFPMALNANGTEMFVGKGTTTGDAGSTDITAGACMLSIVYTVD